MVWSPPEIQRLRLSPNCEHHRLFSRFLLLGGWKSKVASCESIVLSFSLVCSGNWTAQMCLAGGLSFVPSCPSPPPCLAVSSGQRLAAVQVENVTVWAGVKVGLKLSVVLAVCFNFACDTEPHRFYSRVTDQRFTDRLNDTYLGMGVDATGQKYIPRLLRVAGNFPNGQCTLLWNDSFSVWFILFSFLLIPSGTFSCWLSLKRKCKLNSVDTQH